LTKPKTLVSKPWQNFRIENYTKPISLLPVLRVAVPSPPPFCYCCQFLIKIPTLPQRRNKERIHSHRLLQKLALSALCSLSLSVFVSTAREEKLREKTHREYNRKNHE
jgi:hypothetical protein